MIANNEKIKINPDNDDTKKNAILVSIDHVVQLFTSISDTNAGTAYEIASTGFT
tara:strand:- start:1360 stop:1521 length:162 start_codon:yes stop_codon:yes gene_type:complete